VEPPADEDRNRSLAELYREHQSGLRLFLLGLVRDAAEADEVLQQAFLKLLESWHMVEPQTAKGWLYTVAYHEALARRRRRQVDEAAMNRLWARPVWQAGSAQVDPATSTLRAQDAAAVRRSILELPEPQRLVVERRIYGDQTFAAIAQELGCPLNTVLSRMRLAVEKLKQSLEDTQ